MGVSQKDIAKILGVTRVTVTRALNDSPRVSTEMKAQILALSEKMGYQRNYSSHLLKTSETKVISVMRYDIHLTDLHSRWVSYLQEEAQRRGYMLRLDPARSFEKVWGEGSADGFIVFDDYQLYSSHPRLAKNAVDGLLPLVFIDCTADMMAQSIVSMDNRGGAISVAKHLVESGHEKFIYVGVAESGVGRERYLSFRSELLRLGFTEENLYCVSQERWAEEIDSVFLLAEEIQAAIDDGITAVFAASDLYAAGVVRLLRGWGLSVPDDVSVVGYDDSLLSRAYNPPLTTVRQDVRTASRVAIDMLIKHIKTGQPSPNVEVLSELVVRDSSDVRKSAPEYEEGRQIHGLL